MLFTFHQRSKIMDKLQTYLKEHEQQHFNQMVECLSIESVSADPKKEPEIRRCAEWLVKKLSAAGFEHAGLQETGGFPAVYADWLHAGADKPTLMVYGHFDVQPVDPIEKWETPPLQAHGARGYLYGRGPPTTSRSSSRTSFALERS
jgi:acetylornithine deacetylase/succinyl-diaminopimelate desuccinylase-like protein